MFAIHFQTALRSIRYRKLYSAISVFGLAIGLSVCILIGLFIRHEINFESMHPGFENTYRLNWSNNSTGSNFATFFNPVAPILSARLPEIETFSRLALNSHLVTIANEQQYRNISFVDPSFFDIFYYPVRSGSTETIADLASVVLTEVAALELFGTVDAIGEVLTLEDQYDFRVSAVVANNPTNTHLISNIYLNVENLPTLWNFPNIWENLGSDVMYSYVRLSPGANPLDAQQQAEQFMVEELNLGNDFAEAVDVTLQPLRDIHFNSDLQNEMSLQDDVTGAVKPQRQSSDIFVFSGVALLTLGIAVFNFINLQIVQSSRRSREIVMRRVIGAEQSTIASQFLVETVCLSLLALIVALIISYGLIPVFSSMLAIPLTPSDLFELPILMVTAGLVLAVALLSGAYPALVNAHLSPANRLRSESVKGIRTSWFRSGLVVLQFSISIGMLISCAVVYNQINFALTKTLGFNLENVVIINMQNSQARQTYQEMHDRLLAEPNVATVSAGSIIPTQSLSDGSLFYRGDSTEPSIATRRISVSDSYFQSLGMNMVAGRALSEDFATDRMPQFDENNREVSGGLVLNETAAREAGWSNPQEAIGEQLYSQFSFGGNDIRMDYSIVGIVNDAHYGSIRTEIGPVSYTLDDGRNHMIVKFIDANVNDTLAAIDEIWQQYVPDYPINRSFLAESYSAFYAGENRTFILFIGFAAIAAVIACLGLYGLAAFMAERRRKEISIRKILGATVYNIAGLLAWDFSKLVILANIVAWPAAWWFMQDWLTSFAYRTDINFLFFFLAGLVTFVLAMATTFQRAYHVAVANPVDSLRIE